MKRIFTPAVLAVILIALAGCKKGEEYFENNPLAEMRECPVERFIYKTVFDTDTLTFYYNSWGDPVSSSRNRIGTGQPNYEFRYDKKHRLTDYIGWYRNRTGGEFWHKYFYSNAGSKDIVADSIYTFPDIQNGVITRYLDAALAFFTYDKKGRIVTDSAIWDAGRGTVVNHYSYDNNGNLTGRQYDQNLNPHRTNKIWMFLDRDYSINNPFVADSYNSHKLPTAIKLGQESTGLKFLANYFTETQIKYGCN